MMSEEKKELKMWGDKVKKRDRYVCRRCGFDKNLEAHHILPRNEVDLLSYFTLNGVTLCGNCHSLLKGSELSVDLRRFLSDDPYIDKQLKTLLEKLKRIDRCIAKQRKQFLAGGPRSQDRQDRNAKRLYGKGIEHYKSGAYKQAIKWFDKALLQTTNRYETYLKRGWAKHHLKQYQSAAYDFDHAICLKSDDFYPHYSRGIAKFKLNQYETAFSDFDMALRLIAADDDFRCYIHYIRGLMKQQMGLPHDALTDFNEALCAKSDDANVYHSRGLVKQEMGRLDDAIVDFSNAIDLISDNLNYIYHKEGVIENNLEELEDQAEDIVPILCNMYIDRASAMGQHGRVKCAKKDLEKAEDLALRTDDSKRRIDDIREKRRALEEEIL